MHDADPLWHNFGILMTRSAGLLILPCFAAMLFGMETCGAANADDLPGGQAGRGKINPCASYGADFTAVEGSDTCVRIGGRVRVEFGTRGASSAPDNGWATGAAPAALRDEPEQTRSRLRLPSSESDFADPFRH